MLIPIIPHNLQQVFQIGRAICDSDSARNALAQPPIGVNGIAASSSWPPLPHPVVSHAEYSSFQGSIPGPVVLHIPCPHIDAPWAHPFLKAAQLPLDLKSTPVTPHHASVPRLRLTTAGFHCRRQGDFAWSHFFPRSVGFAPTASRAKGAFTIAPSILCQDHAMPSISSYSASPFRQRRTKTPCRFHSKKYLWTELALPNSLFGKAFHWHPVRSTKVIASNTFRGSIRFRPPPGRRRYFRFFFRFRVGMRGSIRLHNSSDTVHDLMALMAFHYHDCQVDVNSYLRISS